MFSASCKHALHGKWPAQIPLTGKSAVLHDADDSSKTGCRPKDIAGAGGKKAIRKVGEQPKQQQQMS